MSETPWICAGRRSSIISIPEGMSASEKRKGVGDFALPLSLPDGAASGQSVSSGLHRDNVSSKSFTSPPVNDANERACKARFAVTWVEEKSHNS